MAPKKAAKGGAKAKGKAEPKKASAAGGSVAKKRRIEGPLPTFPAELERPLVPASTASVGSETLRVFVVDVCEGTSGADCSEIWLHGVTAAGHSVAVVTKDFRPYFYCRCPQESCDEADFCAALETALASDRSKMTTSTGSDVCLVTSVERVKRRALMYYQRDEIDFFQVFLTSPRLMASASQKIERGIRVLRGCGAEPLEFSSATFEANVPPTLRFMVDSGLVGGGWVELPGGSYTVASEKCLLTRAQVEVEAPWSSLVALASEGEYLGLAPLRLLSVDVRADDNGCIVCIATSLARHAEASKPMGTVTWLLRSPPTGDETDDMDVDAGSSDAGCCARLFHLENEGQLLEHFAAFVACCDPDAVIGYELGAAMSLLVDRSQATKASGVARELGRLKGVESKAKTVVIPGTQETRREVLAEGRLMLDVAPLVAKEHKLTSYTLASVVQQILGRTHFELAAADVPRLLAERPSHLARHVLSDAEGAALVFEKLCMGYNLIEMARATGVPIDFLLSRGQMVKVTSQLLRKARAQGFVLPGRGAGGGDTYEGGFVMEPQTGLHEDPVVVLDFASLYPSIMIARNLCYTTLLPEGADRAAASGNGVDPACITRSLATSETGSPHLFVTKDLRRGLLPQILEELLAARAVAKRAMGEASDPIKKAVLNGRQLALKISANSVYGFTGATSGNLPCLEIAASVTAYGRDMIQSTAAFVENSADSPKVIYGDTDSVMVSFGNVSRDEAVRRGKELAAAATEQFPAPIKLAFEKVLQPYLLLNKKRYAGLPWSGEKSLALDMKGIETVRRDWCGLVRQVVEHSLEQLLKPDRSIEAVVEYVRNVIADLRRGAMDMRLLVISKALGKKGEADYVAKAAHVELAEKLRKRDPATAPRPGERVHYVVIAGAAGAKVYERAEDPRYVQANGLPIDADYYIEQQLKQPLLRIFEPVCGDLSAEKISSMLFAGGQGRRAAAPTAMFGSGASKGLGAFIKRSEKCIACSAAVPGSEAFCKSCGDTEKADAAKTAKIASGKAAKARRDELLEICRRCVGPALGNAHERCANVGCEIFFERSRAARDVEDAQAAFARLKIDW
eukprot:TRINITY_DN25129_c0_g1_i1.p1 TRINITY_DN25129_c0_g1~~TRINITY_DN25129_c0_g1_i1.p1  ORF type:complete len:1084 (-),score=236.72 TRINITY_DN25129_c0_g1_i1:126-3377(-)